MKVLKKTLKYYHKEKLCADWIVHNLLDNADSTTSGGLDVNRCSGQSLMVDRSLE